MFDHNQIMALKELVAGEEEDEELVENHYKGSALNPGSVGADGKKKQVAAPNAKVEAKIGQKYVPKPKIMKQEHPEDTNKATYKQKIDEKHQIWSDEQVRELPVNLQDPRKQPQFETLYRQKIGTEDVYLGLSGMDPSSNHCNEIVYKIQLPQTLTKQIQIDLNEKQMVLQTSKYYLAQYFQYPVAYKNSKAEFVADKSMLKLILPVIRSDSL